MSIFVGRFNTFMRNVLFFSFCVWSILKDFHFKNWFHRLSPFLPRFSATWHYIGWVREKTREFPPEQGRRGQSKHRDAEGFLVGCTFNVKGWARDTKRPGKDVTLQLKMTFDSLYIFFSAIMYASNKDTSLGVFFSFQDKSSNVKLAEIQGKEKLIMQNGFREITRVLDTVIYRVKLFDL